MMQSSNQIQQPFLSFNLLLWIHFDHISFKTIFDIKSFNKAKVILIYE
jgi:hypothetical protein